MEICEIEGIGPAYGAKLEKAGIRTPAELLAQGAHPEGREAIAKATGIAEKLIRDWVNRVDLTRVNGIGPQFADLLEESGVDTIPDLAQRNAANLYKKVIQVNEARHLASRDPSMTEIERWIKEAKSLPRVVTH